MRLRAGSRRSKAVDLRGKYLSSGQVARRLGVGRATITWMIRTGRLHPTLQTPLGALFAVSEVKRAEALRDQRQREREQRRRREPVA